jgi:phosphate transport system substrate-binding protein
MKKLIGSLLLVSLVVIGGLLLIGRPELQEQVGRPEVHKLEGTVTLSGAWAIYPTAVAWSEAFEKKHPRVKINVSAGGTGKGAAEAIAGLVDIGMVSRDPHPAEVERGVVPIHISHDAVYPVMSAKNPFLNDLLRTGVKRQTWIALYVTGEITTWNEVVGREVNKPIRVYTRSDASGAAVAWAAYLGKNQEDLKGIGVFGDPGILEAVRRDPLGIAYSNFAYVFTLEGPILKGLKVIPTDANENGIADPDEIINDRKTAIKAIKADKYPLRRRNYFFVRGKPTGLVKEFIRFALSEEGTKIAYKVGTSIPLAKEEREKVLKKLGIE